MSAIQKILDGIAEVYEFEDEVKPYPGKWTQALLAEMEEWQAAKAEYAALVARIAELEAALDSRDERV